MTEKTNLTFSGPANDIIRCPRIATVISIQTANLSNINSTTADSDGPCPGPAKNMIPRTDFFDKFSVGTGTNFHPVRQSFCFTHSNTNSHTP